ncbi:hypothetical protein KFK09_026543 [Dendrobium nobile]|uniref:Uncharacterized protein n=1 Tax=Dendrobium nobile TaxID=94219 RepID=A0A8T3A8F3_DENNO|nr:hypothetical protein KFK09_026543 [Dendrobium nobile]
MFWVCGDLCFMLISIIEIELFKSKMACFMLKGFIIFFGWVYKMFERICVPSLSTENIHSYFYLGFPFKSFLKYVWICYDGFEYKHERGLGMCGIILKGILSYFIGYESIRKKFESFYKGSNLH